MKKKTWFTLLWFILPLAVGGLSALLTRNSTDIYQTLNRPALAPPAILFPIVWGILYVLMGISAAGAYRHGCRRALLVFLAQLLLNFLWPILFFNAQAFAAAFYLILLLWFFVLWSVLQFYRCRPIFGLLQVPYLLWITFAAYLNAMIALLN